MRQNGFTSSSMIGSALIGVLLVGCTHLVRRTLKCPPPRAPVGSSAIGWQHVAGTPRISGQVLSPGRLTPIVSAQVIASLDSSPPARPVNARRANTDARGEFQIDSVAAGRYLIVVRRLGYRISTDTIVVMPDSQIVMTSLLVPDETLLDGCGLIYQAVRVPWWRHK